MNSPTIPGIPNRISSRKRRHAKDLERHRRRCIVCNHPERAAIEEEFFHWRNVWEIGRQYQLVDYRTIYRHARATGLHLERRENLHSALDCIVEWSEDVRPTGDVILRAMRAYSCIDSHGRWTDPPRQVHFTSFPGARPTNPPAADSSASGPDPSASDVIDLDPDELEEEFDEEVVDEAEPDEAEEAAELDEVDDGEGADAETDNELVPEQNASRSDSTACLSRASRDADLPAQASVGANRADAVEEVRKTASQSDEPQPCGSRLQPRHETESRCDSTACAGSLAQAFVGAKSADAVEAELDEAALEEDEAVDAAEFDEEDEANDASRSDQPLAQPHPRNSSPSPHRRAQETSSRSDGTACADPPAQAFVGVNRADAIELIQKPASRSDQPLAQPHPRNSSPSPHRGAQETSSRDDGTACAGSPAQPAPPIPERSPYYREVLITCPPKHSEAPTARPFAATRPPEPRRASPEERRDADLRRALPHPPDPSQPLQAQHYRELLDRCLDPVAARTLGQVGRRPTPRPVGRRTRQRRTG